MHDLTFISIHLEIFSSKTEINNKTKKVSIFIPNILSMTGWFLTLGWTTTFVLDFWMLVIKNTYFFPLKLHVWGMFLNTDFKNSIVNVLNLFAWSESRVHPWHGGRVRAFSAGLGVQSQSTGHLQDNPGLQELLPGGVFAAGQRTPVIVPNQSTLVESPGASSCDCINCMCQEFLLWQHMPA